MKDRFIEQKLNKYVETAKPGIRLIDDAILALRQKRQIKNTAKIIPVKRTRRRGLVIGLSAAACAVFLIGLYAIIQLSLPAKNPNYALSTLSYSTADINEIKRDTSVLVIDYAADDTYTNGRMYFNKNNECAVVSVLYKTIGEGGQDEIVVIADLLGGLQDYKDFKAYNKTDIGDVEVNLRQIWQNGEYYTNAYFRFDGIDYYIKITSPVQGGVQYISLLLGA